MALPVIKTYTSNTALGASLVALTKPGGVSADDLLLIIVGSDDSSKNQQFDTFFDSDNCTWTLIKEQGNTAYDCHIAHFTQQRTGQREFLSDEVLNLFVHSYDKGGNIDTYIRIKN